MTEWKISEQLVDYDAALEQMERRVAAIREDGAEDLIWLLEHPPLYTAGTSAQASDMLDAARFPIYEVGRGGQYTYHGPGQRIAYVMMDLKRDGKQPDVRRFVHDLEQWLINTLAHFDVIGERREGRVGVWVTVGASECKIAALGIRLRRWVSFHGVALNVCPDLSHYQGIVPCGIRDYGVTSLQALGVAVDMPTVNTVLRREFEAIFGASPSA